MCKVYYSFSFVFSSSTFFSENILFLQKRGTERHKQNLSLSLSHSLTLCSYRYTKPTALLPTPPVVSSKRCVQVCNQSCINGTGDIG